jgi:hypothetical protein
VATADGRTYVLSDVDRVARLDLTSPACGAWTQLPLPARAPDAAFGFLGGELVLATSTADASRLWLRR